jgi:sigma-E factor negative regulatory protein RseB
MLNKRNSSSFAWGFFALVMSAVAVAADEPREWLERMNNALTTRNYDGVFSHWQGGKVEMLRIIHRVKDGQVSERLVSLDGSGREFIRTGSELACYLPDKRTVLIEKRADRNPMLGNFPTFDEASTAFYDIKELKRTRLNRRDTRVISVTPKDEFRYGYRLWIDEETAMPMRTQLCDPRGRVIEQLVLALDRQDLKINTNIPDSAFQPEVSTEGFQWLRAEPGISQVLAGNGPALWNALKLPPGFRMTVRAAQIMPGSPEPVAHMVFSDGVATVSVFVETHTTGRAPALAPDKNATTTAQASAAPAAGGAARVGSTSAFSTFVEGHKVTAVGEVPPETVKFIANSVKSSGRPSAPLSLQSPPPR